MLLLVLADRHVGRLIKKNVGGHQVRIGIEPDGGVLAVLSRFLFELRHPVEPAEPGNTVENPGELCVAGHRTLMEQDVRRGVDAGGDQRRRDAPGVGGELPRVLPDGDRVQIDDAEQALEVLLQTHPVADGAQVVAEMQVAGGLDAGEYAGHGLPFGGPGGYAGMPAAGQAAVSPPLLGASPPQAISWRRRTRAFSSLTDAAPVTCAATP